MPYLKTKISEYAKTNEDIDRFASFANEKYEEFRKQSRECRNPPWVLILLKGYWKTNHPAWLTKSNQLNEKIDELEQYSRRECVEIKGIPFSESENTDALVVKVAKLMNVPIKNKWHFHQP